MKLFFKKFVYYTKLKNMEQTKFCKKCGKEKLISEFTKNKRMPDGIWCYCLECNRKMTKAYTEKNKEYSHNYYINNKEKVMESICKYREKNKEKVIQTHREYYQRHKEKLQEYGRQYYLKNRQRMIDYNKKRYKKNKDK